MRAADVGGDAVRVSRIETVLMNNPVRWAVQRYGEVPLLRRMVGLLGGGKR